MLAYVHRLWRKLRWEGGSKKRWSIEKRDRKGKRGKGSKFFCLYSIYKLSIVIISKHVCMFSL